MEAGEDAFGADGAQEADGGGVEGIGEGGLGGDGAAVGAVEVFGAVIGEEQGGIVEIGLGGEAAGLGGFAVDEGFEEGAGGAGGGGGVDLAGGEGVEIERADEGPDFAGAVFEDYGGGVVDSRRGVEAVFEGGSGELLGFGVECGGVDEAAGIPASCELEEVGIGRRGEDRRGEIAVAQRVRADAAGLGLGDFAVAHEEAEHGVEAFFGGGGVAVGAQAGGGLREAAEENGFGFIEVARGAAEVVTGGGFGAVDAPAVGEVVEVGLEDFVFGAGELEVFGEAHLNEFGGEAFVAPVKEGGELHGHGGGAGDDAAVADELPGGAEKGGGVYAVVLEEAVILHGEGVADEVRGQLGERHGEAPARIEAREGVRGVSPAIEKAHGGVLFGELCGVEGEAVREDPGPERRAEEPGCGEPGAQALQAAFPFIRR